MNDDNTAKQSQTSQPPAGQSELGKRVTELAKQLSSQVASVAEGNKPIFSLIMGSVSLADVKTGEQIYRNNGNIGDFLSLNVLDAFEVMTGKSFTEFTADDIHASMYLASSIALHAFHERKSIRTDLGCLEGDEVVKVLTAMKQLGYETEVLAISDDDPQASWNALSEQEQWIVYNKDNINRDLVLYMFEDVLGITFDELQKAEANNLAVYNEKGKTLYQQA